MKNFSVLANTQYGDYKGFISIDSLENKDPFQNLASDKGIDLKKEFLLSVKINLHNLTVVFYTTQDFNDIKDLQDAVKLNNEVKIKEHIKELKDIEEFLKYTKQISISFSPFDNILDLECK